MWRHLKSFLPEGGVRAAHINLYLADFIYRKSLRPTRDRAIRDVLNFDPREFSEEDDGEDEEDEG